MALRMAAVGRVMVSDRNSTVRMTLSSLGFQVFFKYPITG
jgi:hypothetical protein